MTRGDSVIALKRTSAQALLTAFQGLNERDPGIASSNVTSGPLLAGWGCTGPPGGNYWNVQRQN
jgi:hypothetical protein